MGLGDGETALRSPQTFTPDGDGPRGTAAGYLPASTYLAPKPLIAGAIRTNPAVLPPIPFEEELQKKIDTAKEHLNEVLRGGPAHLRSAVRSISRV
ncbi:hypothetical protein [Jannaschia sp. LMIT008]|uniref:hypothetical protein n=1 Tax=Jannaschia maritima TaxID=3032585 RepID=UPI0028123249|nr:hypothetical protein [Jannaschia sp. LMIT008]